MKLEIPRVEPLDWLRGLMAVSIMFYHLTLWLSPRVDSSTTIGRLGIYGVSIFFILSGLSMAIVYNSYIVSLRTSANFLIRRIFRIWPLLWLATIFTILPEVLQTAIFPWKGVAVNLTTLFGFIQPTAYLAVGAWSIGNEMVYYFVTPFIFLAYNYRLWLGNVLFLFSVLAALYFSTILLDANASLSSQWALYVHPVNNFFLYIMGIATYYNFKDVRIKYTLWILGAATSAFIFLPFYGDQIAIVTSSGRVIFVVLSFIMVFCFYKLNVGVPLWLSSALQKLGLSTYGIYILHPIIFQYLILLFPSVLLLNTWIIFSGVCLITILLSYIIYKSIELPLIILGKKLTRKNLKLEGLSLIEQKVI